MTHKSDFTGGQAKLLPHQTHQAITVRATARIAMTAGGQDQSDMPRRSNIFRNCAGDLIGESLDHQGVRRVDVVVMNGDLRVGSPAPQRSLAQMPRAAAD